MLPKAVIFDLDGTVRCCFHRLPFLQKEPKEWDNFYLACKDDTPIRWAVNMIKWIINSNVENDLANEKDEIIQLIFVTGASDISKKETVEWLECHLGLNYVKDVFYSTQNEYKLYMRGYGDHRHDDVLKKEIYEQHIQGIYDVLFVAEDRSRVCAMWRSLGLQVLQCEEGNF